MKNQQGIVWAPILIIIASVVVAGVAGYFLFKAGNSSQTEKSNENVATVNRANGNANTNIVANTNQVENKNASTNIDTAVNTNTVSNTNVADPTVGWKTYSNTENGFSFKHPADWTPKTINDPYYNNKAILTTLQNPGFQEPYGAVGGIFINVYANRNTTESLRAWFSANRERTEEKIMAGINGPCTGTAQRSDITVTVTDEMVDGLAAIAQYEKDLKPTYCEGGATTSKAYYVKKGTTIYEILASSPTSTEADVLLKTFDTIMSTFQFTN